MNVGSGRASREEAAVRKSALTGRQCSDEKSMAHVRGGVSVCEQPLCLAFGPVSFDDS